FEIRVVAQASECEIAASLPCCLAMIWKWIVVGSVSMTVEARWRQRQARRGRGAGLEHGSRPGTRSVDAWQPLGKRWTIRWRRRERSPRASMLSCDKHPPTGEYHDPEIEQIPPGRDLRDARCRRTGKSCASRRYRSQRRR